MYFNKPKKKKKKCIHHTFFVFCWSSLKLFLSIFFYSDDDDDNDCPVVSKWSKWWWWWLSKCLTMNKAKLLVFIIIIFLFFSVTCLSFYINNYYWHCQDAYVCVREWCVAVSVIVFFYIYVIHNCKWWTCVWLYKCKVWKKNLINLKVSFVLTQSHHNTSHQS